jgi:subtilisin family serine protease
MLFQRVFTAACFALLLCDTVAKNTIHRMLEASEIDDKRYLVFIPKPLRSELYDAIKDKAQELGGQIKVEVKKKGVFAASFPDSASIGKMKAIIDATKGDIVFERDQPRELTDITKSSSSSIRAARNLAESVPWGIEKIYEDQGVPGASFYSGLTTKKICVIDSGYLGDHEDLPAGEVSVNGASLTDTATCSYHGSHCTGTIGAVGGNGKGVVGVYPGPVGIRVARTFKPTFFGLLCGFIYAGDLIGAVQDCFDSGAQITSMSLGGTGSSTTERNAFKEFFDVDGMLNIAASGNDGPGAISYPAYYPSVVSVGATDDTDKIASFSSTNSEVDISAPGVEVLSTIGPRSSYAYYDGTSMATPHVSGAALVLWNKYPTCSNSEIRNALEDAAEDLGPVGRDNAYGHGRLNYWAASDILNASGCSGGGGGGCTDSTGSVSGKDCAWVAADPTARCPLCSGSICADVFCPVTCGTCP